MIVRPVKTKIFREGEDLADFVIAHIPKVPEGSIVVVTSKIVALSEGRTEVVKNEREKESLIRRESSVALKAGKVWLTLKDGLLMANAGVDDSNGNGKIILLPKNSFSSAERLRKTLQKNYTINRIGIVITDSRVMPLRAGVTAVALGYAGFSGIRDYRGTKDLFGRTFKYSQTNVADSLATAAALVMGEGAERQPLAIIEAAPVQFSERIHKREINIPPSQDLYKPMLKIPKRQK